MPAPVSSVSAEVYYDQRRAEQKLGFLQPNPATNISYLIARFRQSAVTVRALFAVLVGEA